MVAAKTEDFGPSWSWKELPSLSPRPPLPLLPSPPTPSALLPQGLTVNREAGSALKLAPRAGCADLGAGGWRGEGQSWNAASLTSVLGCPLPAAHSPQPTESGHPTPLRFLVSSPCQTFLAGCPLLAGLPTCPPYPTQYYQGLFPTSTEDSLLASVAATS